MPIDQPRAENRVAPADGRFRFPADVRDQVPLMYTLIAQKPQAD